MLRYWMLVYRISSSSIQDSEKCPRHDITAQEKPVCLDQRNYYYFREAYELVHSPSFGV